LVVIRICALDAPKSLPTEHYALSSFLLVSSSARSNLPIELADVAASHVYLGRLPALEHGICGVAQRFAQRSQNGQRLIVIRHPPGLQGAQHSIRVPSNRASKTFCLDHR
jgi:hypothetical protein